MTYEELDRQARALGASLQSIGAQGERALLLYPPGLEYITAFFGCLYAGVIAVPVYPPRSGQPIPRLQTIATDAQAQLILAPEPNHSLLESLCIQEPNLRALHCMGIPRATNGMENQWRDPAVTSNTLAFLQYTSGSTGEPRGVMVSHGNLRHNLALMTHVIEGTPCGSELATYEHDTTRYSSVVSWLPPYHDMGLIGGILLPLYAARPVTLMAPEAFLQRPYRWLQAISHYRAAYSAGPDFAYDLCVHKITPEQRATLDLSGWHFALCGAEPVRQQTLERFVATFSPCGFRREAFYPSYGLAEATLMVSGGKQAAAPVIKTFQKRALERNQVVIASTAQDAGQTLVGCGQASLDQEIVIVHPETLIRCQPDQIGEIWVSGGSVAQGYWDRHEETEHTFRAKMRDTDEGSFLRTGDLGFFHDGELYVTGRLKDLIIIRGTNHYPQDIEQTVEQSHPALQLKCGAAFAVEVGGTERLVIVQGVNRPNKIDVDAVVTAIRRAVTAAHGIQVHAVVLVRPGSVPKTSSGKIQRRATRAAYLEGALQVVGRWQEESSADNAKQALRSHTPLRTAEAFEAWLILQLASRLKIDPRTIDLHTPIVHYGLDSLGAAEIISEIEDVFKVPIQVEKLFVDSPSIADISSQLHEYLTKSSRISETDSAIKKQQICQNNFSINRGREIKRNNNNEHFPFNNNKESSSKERNKKYNIPGGETCRRSHAFSDYVNPYLGSLLSSLNMDKQFTQGQGCYLYDKDGKRYLDFIAQYGALPFGFNHPYIWGAVDAMHHTQEPSFVQPSFLDAAGELARRLIEVSPAGLRYVTFTNSGAEAVEAAIKLCRAATGRLGILATHNSFHGKTLGALSATSNRKYQAVFGAPIQHFASIPFGAIDALKQALFSAPDYYAAFIVEPIQGEGGIVEAPVGYLKQAQEICREAGTLFIVDEIQTGLGRTGAMFACDTEGVTPDVMTIAKALGGGLVPIGACLCTEDVFTEEFALKHSSTFAGNTLACRVALAALDMLEENDRSLIHQVATNGARLKAELLHLQRHYPDLIESVRGRGYMLGVRFGADRHTWESSLLGYVAEQGFLTALVSSYMLNVAGVRTAPTLHGGDVLRIEPPLIATWEQCQAFLNALQGTLKALEGGNTAHFTGHLIGFESNNVEFIPRKTSQRRRRVSRREQDGRFAFLLHPLHDGSYADVDASLAQLSEDQMQRLRTRLLDHLDPMPVGEASIVSKTGQTAYGEFIVVPQAAEELLRMSYEQAVAEIELAANLAMERGAKIVGLGGFLSVVTRGGLSLRNKGLPALTTGNSNTVMAAKEVIHQACETVESALSNSSLAIVGATGSVGRAISVLLSKEVSQLILVGNPAHPKQSQRRLFEVAGDILHFLWDLYCHQHQFTPGTLGDRLLAMAALCPPHAEASDFVQLAKQIQRHCRALVVTTDIDHWLPQADVVVTATSSVDRLVTSQHLKRNAIVCDLSRPSNVSPEVEETRSDILVINGGIVRVPGQPDFGFRFGLGNGLVYACMAETMLLALEHQYQDTSLGINLDMQTIMDMKTLSDKHGFEVCYQKFLSSSGTRRITKHENGDMLTDGRVCGHP